jgi:DNA-binding winged helix-turn-helix (wHTH) protein/TolB-like protein
MKDIINQNLSPDRSLGEGLPADGPSEDEQPIDGLPRASTCVSEVSRVDSNYLAGEILIQPELGQVTAAQKVARLTPVNMKVLVTLLKRPGEVISRADIYQQVWGNQVVSDDTLTRAISDIRAVFKSLAIEIKLIETIPKKGYRWVIDSQVSKEVVAEQSERLPASRQTQESQDKSSLAAQPVDNSQLLVRQQKPGVANWMQWSIGTLAAVTLFALLAFITVWLVKGQFSDRYIKVAMMPVELVSQQQNGLAQQLSEGLQQRVLKTKDIRLLSSRMRHDLQHPEVHYLAHEYSATWLIEANIRASADQAKITLNLVDAQSAVVLESLAVTLSNEQQQLPQLIETFVSRMVQMAAEL